MEFANAKLLDLKLTESLLSIEKAQQAPFLRVVGYIPTRLALFPGFTLAISTSKSCLVLE